MLLVVLAAARSTRTATNWQLAEPKASVVGVPHSPRKVLDEWHPTLVRYLGLCLSAYMCYQYVVGPAPTPALIPLATGLLLYKTVYGDGRKE